MRPLSLCILGGTGFLGTRLVARLIKDNHRVTVLSRDRELHKHLLVLPGLTLENCDVYEEAQLSERIRRRRLPPRAPRIDARGTSGRAFRGRRAAAADFRAQGGPRCAELLPAL